MATPSCSRSVSALLLLTGLATLSGCQTWGLTPGTVTTRAVTDLCERGWREIPAAPYSASRDTPQTVQSVRETNLAIDQSNAARSAFGCP